MLISDVLWLNFSNFKKCLEKENITMTKKGIDSVSADFGLITIAYNVKRMIHVFGAEELIKRLKNTLQNVVRGVIV